jgi:hypothetical protein
VYCSLGYRSARVVRRLRDAGFRRASNLEGGAFQWAAEGRGLVDASAPTALVHPYGAFWGFLLLDARHRGRAA